MPNPADFPFIERTHVKCNMCLTVLLCIDSAFMLVMQVKGGK